MPYKGLQYPECFAFKHTVGVLKSNRKDKGGPFFWLSTIQEETREDVENSGIKFLHLTPEMQKIADLGSVNFAKKGQKVKFYGKKDYWNGSWYVSYPLIYSLYYISNK